MNQEITDILTTLAVSGGEEMAGKLQAYIQELESRIPTRFGVKFEDGRCITRKGQIAWVRSKEEAEKDVRAWGAKFILVMQPADCSCERWKVVEELEVTAK